MIAFCPNCKGKLKDRKELAQHVKECPSCDARFFILETTKPKETNQ